MWNLQVSLQHNKESGWHNLPFDQILKSIEDSISHFLIKQDGETRYKFH